MCSSPLLPSSRSSSLSRRKAAGLSEAARSTGRDGALRVRRHWSLKLSPLPLLELCRNAVDRADDDACLRRLVILRKIGGGGAEGGEAQRRLRLSRKPVLIVLLKSDSDHLHWTGGLVSRFDWWTSRSLVFGQLGKGGWSRGFGRSDSVIVL
jgi:hypothetical protein